MYYYKIVNSNFVTNVVGLDNSQIPLMNHNKSAKTFTFKNRQTDRGVIFNMG